MGVASVERDGSFKLKGDPRVLYSTMMLIRMTIITDVPNFLLSALQIALRYASVRRQFSTVHGSKDERKIIDYQTMQHQLTPTLAQGIMQAANRHFFREQYKLMIDDIKLGKFDRMDVLHHLLAGFKSYFSEEVIVGVEACRRSAGGAGYASFSGFTELGNATSPVPTYEGDNTVMLLQASRYILKLVQRASKGQTLPYPFEYISKIKHLLSLKDKGTSVEQLLDLSLLGEALAVRASFLISDTLTQIAQSKAPAKVQDNELFAQAKLTMV